MVVRNHYFKYRLRDLYSGPRGQHNRETPHTKTEKGGGYRPFLFSITVCVPLVDKLQS